jgi:hypothetical protein
LRFDIFQGPFTKNDQLTASPFTNAFVFIPNVTVSIATQVVDALNGVGAPSRRELLEQREIMEYARGNIDARYHAWVRRMAEQDAIEKQAVVENLTLGYVTHDVRSIYFLPVTLLFNYFDKVLPRRRRRHTA